MVQTAPVSAIIPCYNSTKTLERAVMSVYRQTQRPAELILVDNGSRDGTVDLMEQLAERLGPGWIQVLVNEKNVGCSGSRNRGWNAATQRYIAFLDSDDSWHPRKVELQYRHMIQHPYVAASAHGFTILRPGDTELEVKEVFEVVPHTAKSLLHRNPFVTPSAMIRREIKERYQEGRSDMEDHLLWIDIAYAHGPVDYLNVPLTHLYKALWGEGGLGSRLWAMERGELRNYGYLRATGRISLTEAARLAFFSLAKFTRRVFLTYYRRAFAK